MHYVLLYKLYITKINGVYLLSKMALQSIRAIRRAVGAGAVGAYEK